MGDTSNSKQKEDPVWSAAWSWVIRQHAPEGFDAGAAAELARWLEADPLHRKAYDKAGRLWLLTGLVPPRNDIEIPGATDDDHGR
jgi:transmembrane sensor